jgi:hypothetical protein
MENNKLIAEFMGMQDTPIGWYDNEEAFPNLLRTEGNTFDNLLFHTSWDWLMPVVEKCMQTGDNTDEWDDLYNALSTVNKTNLHQAVVEFIKQYNK